VELVAGLARIQHDLDEIVRRNLPTVLISCLRDPHGTANPPHDVRLYRLSWNW
jgi:hypothetical protein